MDKGLIIRVDFYKKTGKWYAGGQVNVGNERLWRGENFLRAIVDNQQILNDGWQGNYHVVTDDLHENFEKREYQEFSKAFFEANLFNEMKKQVKITV